MRLVDPRSSGARIAALMTAFTTALLAVALTAGTAQADAYASSGTRCTIVGTNGPDVLRGTAHRDVICGRGGNDRISAGGGSDVIDGGPGNDRINGSAGKDLVYGGPGRDRLFGDDGDDRLRGGTGNDELSGMDGADDLRGDAGREVIYGGTGNDRVNGGADGDKVRGGSGNDVINGAAGNDDLQGNSGADVINGAAGNDDLQGNSGADVLRGSDGVDVLSGDTGDDDLWGNGGDDELAGGTGADESDGGAGFNICDTPSETADSQIRCVTDRSAPIIGEVTLSRTVVDVSAATQVIRAYVHVTDDTGVKRVTIGNEASLVSGSRHDGTWRADFAVPRYILPGPRTLEIAVHDRVGRSTSASRADAYTVRNTVYDREMPVVRSLTLDKTSVDVRTAARTITGTVRITDDLAGAVEVSLCPAHAFPTGTPSFRQAGGCTPMGQLSGTDRDATWGGTLTVPKLAPGGTWNVSVWVNDAAGNLGTGYWLGPDELAAQREEQADDGMDTRPLPGGAGRFTVVGSVPDTHAPALTSLRLSATTVDTTPGAVRVTADITATDLEGVTSVGLFIDGYPGWPERPASSDVQVAWLDADDFARVSGTTREGVWRGSFVVPGGMPDGTYWIQTIVQDTAHFESWVSGDSSWAGGSTHLLEDTPQPSATHFTVANSGS